MPKVSATHKLLIISGPTATGKTNLAVRFAKRLNGELVSADSRQVYRGLDIISGKDTKELQGVPIWLYDVVSVGEPFSVSLYRKLAVPVIEDIYARGKVPIVVGGTGLYIRSIISPPETIDIPPDAAARTLWTMYTVSSLQKELVSLNSTRFSQMNESDRNNPRRLIRALEIEAWERVHGVPQGYAPDFDCYWIGLKRDMDTLSTQIAARVKDRWDHGALEEVRKFPDAVATGMVPMKRYLQGQISEQQALEEWAREEIAYAKRQMTWFRKQSGIVWYDTEKSGYERLLECDIDTWYTSEKR
jgi:tRNA dimethylallyltransferase